jgi:hypothetical protein
MPFCYAHIIYIMICPGRIAVDGFRVGSKQELLSGPNFIPVKIAVNPSCCLSKCSLCKERSDQCAVQEILMNTVITVGDTGIIAITKENLRPVRSGILSLQENVF